MPQFDDKAFITFLGGSMVEFADQTLERVFQVTEGDRRLVRLNLIAFCTFGLTWSALDKLNGPALDTFTAGVIHGAAEKCGISATDRVIRFLRSRHQGFLQAFAGFNDNQSGVTLTSYFLACCSVDRLEVAYADIFPDPSDLEELERMGVSLTPGGSDLIRRVRAMSKPAIYPLNSTKSNDLFMIFMAILKRLKEVFARLDQ